MPRTALCAALSLLFSAAVLAQAPGTAPPSLGAGLSELEGTQGHAPSSLSELEGTEGHAPAASSLADLEGTHGHAAGDDGVTCEAPSACIETATQLPLRVLPRPFSNVLRSPDDAQAGTQDGVVLSNIPAFRPLYVFERRDLDLRDPVAPRGWYQVGRTREQAEGWMQAADVLEWRQALLVSYTHPGGPIEGRQPVLMFRDRGTLESLVDDFDMSGRAQTLYSSISAGEIPESVVSMEPQRFVDITRQFYMLPILQWSQTRIDGDDARLLQLAAAVPRQRGADVLSDDDYRQQAQAPRDGVAGAHLADLKVDLVFVIDTTRSMQPFIDMTREAVARMTRSFTAETAERFRFGLVTFRDAIEVIPQLEYVTRNHTPELVDGATLVELLQNSAKATAVGSLDYAEEVFAGVDVGLRSAWREDALRFMIVIGDASAHPKGHAQNVTGKDEVDLRREADDAQVHLLSIHLQDPRATEDHAFAIQQFGHLARVRGTQDRQALEEVNAFEEAEYQALVDSVTARFNERLTSAAGLAPASAPPVSAAAAPGVLDATPGAAPVESTDRLWEAAMVEYLGKGANPPKDIVAWALDRDLVNPADRALDVRVLVTREQLSGLAGALDQVVQALMRAEVTQARFFEALQSVAGQAIKRPDEMDQAGRLADTGLLPAFIQSLPYRSDILSLSDEMFASMTAEQRSQLEWSILAKLEQYRAINEQVDAWFRLNDTDPDREMVYPLHLDYLP